jgi:D-lactate dehydrogenase (cytochrome)
MTETFTASRAPEVIVALRPTFGDRLLTSRAAREQHGSGESWLPSAPPDAVVMAQSTDEVAQVLAACNAHRVPVIPFGAGSSIEGQIHAINGGISLDLSRLDRILAVNAADMDCRVECGVTRQRLNEELRATGLFFPFDLGAHATLGGMAATRASGTTTVHYGSMRDLIMGLTVVLPDGRIVRTGSRARKSASGYDLTHLFIGSEGTLGVITELTLRLHGQPALRQSLLASFPDLESATETVVAALQTGLALNRIELADSLQMTAINRYSWAGLPETPTLWVELAGSEVAVPHDLSLFEQLAQDAGAIRIQRAETAEAANRLWRIRHDALYAARALRPGIKGISTDVCVPVSSLPDCIGRIQRVIAATDLKAPLIGHVGDGNFHLVLLFDPADAAETAAARRINATLVDLALSMGGTATGEHGVGLGKKAYMAAEHGPALDLMRAIKRAVDPENIMNPGKIFDL